MVRKRLKAGLTNLKSFVPPTAGPDELLGELLHDVQLGNMHPDSKTFVDLVSERKLRRIARAYERARQQPDFNLHTFVERHFQEYLTKRHPSLQPQSERSASEHIDALWPTLTHSNYRSRGSLMALPYPYIVPGGRFVELYYWDSYFTMLGLSVGGHTELIEDMIKNYAYLIRKVGFIPTANRTYYLSRSDPPFFALMIQLLAKKRGKRVYGQYLPYLLAEYRFWMRDKRNLNSRSPALRRVVRMPDGSVLNRFYDAKAAPRPEGYREDISTAAAAQGRHLGDIYINIRAAAESGWDFSTRWLKESGEMSTVQTVDIVPVDLNCLLYELEQTIAYAYSLLRQNLMSRRFRGRAEARAAAIRSYCWSAKDGFYFDYNFEQSALTPSWHLGAVYPLYVGIASQEEATQVAAVLERDFLKPGGLVTTLIDSGQQWDAPNGWAPLQWVAYQGLRRYGFDELAATLKNRWLALNVEVYEEKNTFFEKYNVVHPGAGAGGGEYPRQEGFGWTNGVFLAMEADD